MADTSLSEALQGIYTQPGTTPWGLGAMTLAQTTPALINPYGSAGANFGIALGSGLISALLGYQAKKQAMEQNLALQPFITQALQAQSPEALDIVMQQPGAGALADVGTQLKLSMIQSKAAADERKREFADQLMLTMAKEQGIVPKGFETLVTMPETGQLTPKEQRELAFEKRKKQELTAIEEPAQKLITFDTMRKEFNALPEVKDYSTVSKAAEVVAKAVKDPSAVAAAELVKRAIQLIEPGLAVQVGEQRAIEQSQSIPDAYKAQLTKALTGQGVFGEQVRNDIINLARRSYEAQTNKYDQARTYYQNQLSQRQINQDISYLGAAKPFDYYLENANKPSGRQRLQEIASQIQAETDPAKRQALQLEAEGIYARLKGG
jgi:hypothetical protein